MDWTGCDLVEVIPGKHSGDPSIRGTRIPADAIVSNFEAGSSMEEIAENYPSASMEAIEALIAFAHARRMSCSICGEGELVRDTRDLPFVSKGENRAIPGVTGDFCPACGEVVLDTAEAARVGAMMLQNEKPQGRR
jgi:YgiT-type zinc finger domain-containing protein